MPKDKSVKEIAKECYNAVERVINNELPVPSCPQKAAHVKWKRDQVKEELAAKYRQTKVTGPMQIKVEI